MFLLGLPCRLKSCHYHHHCHKHHQFRPYHNLPAQNWEGWGSYPAEKKICNYFQYRLMYHYTLQIILSQFPTFDFIPLTSLAYQKHEGLHFVLKTKKKQIFSLPPSHSKLPKVGGSKECTYEQISDEELNGFKLA